MRKFILAAIFAAATAQTAQAAELNVFVPPLVREGGLPEIAAAFEKKTGVKVNVTTHAMGRSINDIEKGPVAPDVIFLLSDYMGTVALDKQLKGNFIPIGRVYMGMAVRKGEPVPDISTMDKFIAVMKASKGVAYSDPSPARGSVEANMVDSIIHRPDMAGVIGVHATTTPGGATAPNGPAYLIQGHGDLTLQPMNEMDEPELQIVGKVPAELHAFLDSSVAISTRAANPKSADAFIKFCMSAEARPLWHKAMELFY